jgi:hypothetical protein
MCTVSNKLKLCTCKNDATITKDFWALYRFVKGKKDIVIGESVMPAFIDPEKDIYNQNLLLKLLNEGNVFDEPLFPINKDRLQISFDLEEKGQLNYGFLFKTNQWTIIEYDCFDWLTAHKEIKEGKITT